MSEIIFPSEVMSEVDWENPLTDGLKLALFCKEGSGNTLLDAVSGAIFTPDVGTTDWSGEGIATDIDNTLYTADSQNFSFDGNRPWLLHYKQFVPTTSGTSYFRFKLTNADTSYLSWTQEMYTGGGLLTLKGTSWNTVYSDTSPYFPTKINDVVSVSIHNNVNNQTVDMYLNGVLTEQVDMSGAAANITGSYGDLSSITIKMGILLPLHTLMFWDETTVTSSDIASLAENPYQLAKTKEKVEQEYGLKLTTGTEQITFPLTGAWTGTLTYSDGTTSSESGTGDFTLDGTVEKHITSFNLVDTVQSHFWEFNQTTGSTVTDHYNGSVATLVGFPADSGYVRGDTGEIAGYAFGGVSNLVFPDFLLSSGEFAFEFQVTVDNLTSNKFIVATVDYKFIIYVNTNGIICTQYYKTNSAASWPRSPFVLTAGVKSPLLKFVYTGNNIEYYSEGVLISTYTNMTDADQTTPVTTTGSSPNGSAQLTIHKLNMTNALDNRSYDFTTGDQDQIIDTVGNNHATINNASTVKWQPIIPIDVYTVGAGKDYTLDGFRNIAYVASEGTHTVGVLHEMESLTSDGCFDFQYMDTDKVVEFKAAVGKEFTGKVQGLAGLDNSNGFMKSIGAKNGTIFNNIEFLGSGIGRADFNNCYVNALVGYPNMRGGVWVNTGSLDWGKYRCRDTVIDTGGYVIKNRSNWDDSLLQNCVVSGDIHSDMPHENCVASGTVTGASSTGSVDFTGAFVDEAQGDYRINQAWADTNLVGQGWNGSDIVDWGYYTEAVTSSINLLNIGANTVLDVKYYDGASLVDVILQVNGTIVWQI